MTEEISSRGDLVNSTQTDMLSQGMSNLNLTSSTSTDLAEGQQQTPPSPSSGLVDDQSQASPGPIQSSETPNQSNPRRRNDVLLVMVLKATDTFEYESSETGGKKMFHATVAPVAPVDECYHMKVFNIDLKEKFTKNKFIIISNYIKKKDILDIDEDSYVFKLDPDEKIKLSISHTENASETPQICDIQNGKVGTLISGLFTLYKITVKTVNTYYEIKDDSGSIEVVVNKKCFDINCKEGDKLQLFCFYLKTIETQPKLVCGEHSFIKIQNSETPNQSNPRRKNDVLLVMVLKATDTFEYESSETGGKKMFHATVAPVAPVDECYHMKVFNIDLKEKFTKNKFIIISNYIKKKDILDIDEDSYVFKLDPDEKIKVSISHTENASETPQICDIQNGKVGTLISGLFTLYKKKVNPKNTIYEMKDNSGSIEVVGNGKWYNINCKEGDKLQLFCFYLKTIEKQPKLVCGEHSFIKVIKAGK